VRALPIRSFDYASPLGTWTFRECRPRELSAWIETIWEVEGTVTHVRERVFPNGRVDLLVNLGPPQRLIEGSGDERFEDGWLSGLQQRALVIESAPRTHVFGVRLRPEGARLLLGLPMRLVSGRVADLAGVLGSTGRGLVRRIARAGSFEHRAAFVCRWAEERLARSPPGASYVGWIAAQIEAAGGVCAIDELRRAASVSRKKLAADFREQVGLTPKLLARIVRFRRALSMLEGPGPSLTSVALAAGYYDHSHMTLDFRALAGLAPSEFLAARYPDGNSAVAV
jgi:AraC-like DNA-binding protein